MLEWLDWLTWLIPRRPKARLGTSSHMRTHMLYLAWDASLWSWYKPYACPHTSHHLIQAIKRSWDSRSKYTCNNIHLNVIEWYWWRWLFRRLSSSGHLYIWMPCFVAKNIWIRLLHTLQPPVNTIHLHLISRSFIIGESSITWTDLENFKLFNMWTSERNPSLLLWHSSFCTL
jgi:hypothetical protein